LLVRVWDEIMVEMTDEMMHKMMGEMLDLVVGMADKILMMGNLIDWAQIGRYPVSVPIGVCRTYINIKQCRDKNIYYYC